MTSPGTTTAQVAQTWREPLGKVGLAAKGVLYLVLGLLAIQFARGQTSSDEVSQSGAIEKVAEQPFGKLLLVAMSVGLICLTIWHVIQALTGDPVEGDEPADRAKYAAKAVIYGALSVTAIKITMDHWDGEATQTSSDGNDQSQQAASALFDAPGGVALVVVLGLVLLGIAGYQLVKYVINGEHADRLAAGGDERKALELMGRIGYGARAVVAAGAGVFFLVAAIQHDPNESKGISGVLQELADASWGRIVLWLVAIGLALFGLFCFAEAKLRRAH